MMWRDPALHKADVRVGGEVPEYIGELVDLARRCVQPQPDDRPTITYVRAALQHLKPDYAITFSSVGAPRSGARNAECAGYCGTMSHDAAGVWCTNGTHFVCGACVPPHVKTEQENGVALSAIPCVANRGDGGGGGEGCDGGRLTLADITRFLAPAHLQMSVAAAADAARAAGQEEVRRATAAQMEALRQALREANQQNAAATQAENEVLPFVREFHLLMCDLCPNPACGVAFDFDPATQCIAMNEGQGRCPCGVPFCAAWLAPQPCPGHHGAHAFLWSEHALTEYRKGVKQRRLDALVARVPQQLRRRFLDQIALDAIQLGIRVPQ